MFAGAGFLVALTITRGVTYALHVEGAGTGGGIVIRGVHVHHLVFGIVLLLAVGYAWLLLYAVDPADHRLSARVSAVLYGVAAALVLDEFPLWLELQDVYWTRQGGRLTIDAVAAFAALLTVTALLWPYMVALATHLGRRPSPPGGRGPG